MKYLVTLNVSKKETLIHVNRKGQSYLKIYHGTEVELTENELVLAVIGCAGAVTFSPVFQPKPIEKCERKAEK
jgi:hypothetical protein